MRQHDDPNAQLAYDAWTDSTVRKAEHVLDCHNGCTDQMMRCLVGMDAAEEERSAWRRYHDVRMSTGVMA